MQVARAGYLCQWVEGKTPPAQVAMGETTTCASGLSASWYGMQQQHATTITTTSDRIGAAQHDAAISATCVRAMVVVCVVVVVYVEVEVYKDIYI